MKFQVYLVVGTSLSCFPALALGQCLPAQDCSTLGYTASSCNGGKGVKCPFGNGWFCAGDESTVCAENGFKYTCIGTGYSGGLEQSCGGKYTQCSCADGYEWKDGSCQQIQDGPQGDLYYCNGKVVGVKTGNMNFYVAIDDLGEMDWGSAGSSCANYTFCGSAKGTLPEVDQLLILYNNKSTLNSLLRSIKGGWGLKEDFYWSSTISYDYYNQPCYVNMSYGSYSCYSGGVEDDYVRCILTSW